MADAVRPTWRDLTWVVWPAVAALALELSFYFGQHVRVATVALPLAFLGRWSARRAPTRSVTPTWAVPAEHRLVCADAGVVLAAATMPITMTLGFPRDVLFLGLAYLPIAAAAALVLPRLVRAALGQPWLRLTPEAVVVRGRPLPWDDLQRVVLSGDPRPQIVIGVRSQRAAVLHEAYVRANLLYLLDLVGYYAAHPERRAAIGSSDEAERVTVALREARLRVPASVEPIPVPT